MPQNLRLNLGAATYSASSFSKNRVWIGLQLNVLQIYPAIKFPQNPVKLSLDLDSDSVDEALIVRCYFYEILAVSPVDTRARSS